MASDLFKIKTPPSLVGLMSGDDPETWPIVSGDADQDPEKWPIVPPEQVVVPDDPESFPMASDSEINSVLKSPKAPMNPTLKTIAAGGKPLFAPIKDKFKEEISISAGKPFTEDDLYREWYNARKSGNLQAAQGLAKIFLEEHSQSKYYHTVKTNTPQFQEVKPETFSKRDPQTIKNELHALLYKRNQLVKSTQIQPAAGYENDPKALAAIMEAQHKTLGLLDEQINHLREERGTQKNAGAYFPVDELEKLRKKMSSEQIKQVILDSTARQLGLSQLEVETLTQKYGKHPIDFSIHPETGQPFKNAGELVDYVISQGKSAGGLSEFVIPSTTIRLLDKERRGMNTSEEMARAAGRGLHYIPDQYFKTEQQRKADPKGWLKQLKDIDPQQAGALLMEIGRSRPVTDEERKAARIEGSTGVVSMALDVVGASQGIGSLGGQLGSHSLNILSGAGGVVAPAIAYLGALSGIKGLEDLGLEAARTSGAIGNVYGRDNALGKLERGAASMAAFMFTPGGQVGIGLMGAMTQMGQAYQEMMDQGMNRSDAKRLALLFAPAGALEAFGVNQASVLGQLKKEGIKTLIKEIAEEFVKGGAKETTQELTQNIMSDWIAKGIYDPKRNVFDANQLWDSAWVSFLLGGVGEGGGRLSSGLREIKHQQADFKKVTGYKTLYDAGEPLTPQQWTDFADTAARVYAREQGLKEPTSRIIEKARHLIIPAEVAATTEIETAPEPSNVDVRAQMQQPAPLGETGLEDLGRAVNEQQTTALPSVVFRSDNGAPLEVLEQQGTAYRVRNAVGRTYLIHQNATFIPEGVTSEGAGQTLLHGQTGEPLSVLGSNRSGYIVKNDQNKIYNIHKNNTKPLQISSERNATPETPTTLNAQMQALAEGRKSAVLITPGEQLPEISEGFITTETPAGVFIHTPAVSQQDVLDLALMDNYHSLLGLVAPRPLEGESAVTVVAQDKDGNELQTAVVPPEDVKLQRFEFKKIYPGSVVSIGDQNLTKAVLSQRADEIERQQVQATEEQNQTEAKSQERVKLLEEATELDKEIKRSVKLLDSAKEKGKEDLIKLRQKQLDKTTARKEEIDAQLGEQEQRGLTPEQEVEANKARLPEDMVAVGPEAFGIPEDGGPIPEGTRLGSKTELSAEELREVGFPALDTSKMQKPKDAGERTPQQIGQLLKGKQTTAELISDLPSLHKKLQSLNLDAQQQLEAYEAMGLNFKAAVQMMGTIRGVQSETGEIPLVNVLYRSGGKDLKYRVLGRFPAGEKVLVMSPDNKVKIIQSPFGQTGNTRVKGGTTRAHFGTVPTIKWQEIGMEGDAWPTKAEIHRVNPAVDNVLDLSDSELEEYFPEVYKRVREAQDSFGDSAGREMMKIASKEGDSTDSPEVQKSRDAIHEMFNTRLSSSQAVAIWRPKTKRIFLNARAEKVLQVFYRELIGWKLPEGVSQAFHGISLSPNRLENLLNLMYHGSSSVPVSLRSEVREITEALYAAYKTGEPIVIATTLSPDIKQVVRHEEFHKSQDKIEFTFKDKYLSSRRLEKLPYTDRLKDSLSSMGYSRDIREVVTEASAFVASGDHNRIGLSEEEGIEFLDAYFRTVASIYGADSLSYFSHIAGEYLRLRNSLKAKPPITLLQRLGGLLNRLMRDEAPPLANVGEMLYNTAVVTGNDLLNLYTEQKTWSQKMIEKLGDNIKSYLNQVWDVLHGRTEMFFSPLERAIKLDLPDKGTADQVKGVLRKAGVSDDEMKWTGFDTFLREKGMKEEKITKKDALDFFQKNKIQLTERFFGGEQLDPTPEQINRLNTLAEKDFQKIITPEERQELIHLRAIQDQLAPPPPKFTTHTIPGGTNHREITLAYPTVSQIISTLHPEWRIAYEAAVRKADFPEQVRLTAEINSIMFGKSTNEYIPPGSHRYDVPEADTNRIALLRVNDRVGPNGEKILHADEYQDDLQNEIQKKKNEIKNLKTDFGKKGLHVRYDYLSGWQVLSESGQVFAHDLRDEAKALDIIKDIESGKIVAAPTQVELRNKELDRLQNLLPFRGKSHELAMKYALGYAINHGYDMLTWSTGKIVQERYPGQPKEGAGKSVLYDQMIPDFMRKYTKKWKGEISSVPIDASTTASVPELKPFDRAAWSAYQGAEEFDDGDPLIGSTFVNIDGRKQQVTLIASRTGLAMTDMAENYFDLSAEWEKQDDAKRFINTLWSNPESPLWNQLEQRLGDAQRIEPSVGTEDVHALSITPQMRDSILRSGQSLFGSTEGQPSAVTDAMINLREQQTRKRRNPSVIELESKKAQRPTSTLLSEPGYIYHTTNEDRAAGIASDSIRTHKPHEFTDQATWPDGSIEKRSYWSRDAGIVWHFSPESGAAVILRTKETPDFKQESTGDIFTRKPVVSAQIEILGDDNKWHPLKMFFEEDGKSLLSEEYRELESKNLSEETLVQNIHDHSEEAAEMIDTGRVHLGEQMTNQAVVRASKAGRTIHALGQGGEAILDYREKSNRLYLNDASGEILRILRTIHEGESLYEVRVNEDGIRADIYNLWAKEVIQTLDSFKEARDWVSEHSISSIEGLALDTPRLKALSRTIDSLLKFNFNPAAKPVLQDLHNAFERSLQKNQPLIVVELSGDTTRQAVKHEEVHRVEFMIRDAFEGMLPDVHEITQLPHMQHLTRRISEVKGYAPDPRVVAMEAIARISTGDNVDLELTEDEEIEFLSSYYTMMADTYHEDVLGQFKLITDKAREVRDAVQAEFRQYDESGQVDKELGATAETISGMEGGGEGGAEVRVAESSRRTDTPEFRNWFKESKVVDEQGQPLRVYHGTSEDFSHFDPKAKHASLEYADPEELEEFIDTPGAGRVIFFSDDGAVASAFAEMSAQWKPGYRRSSDPVGQNVMSVFLRIENPLVVDLSDKSQSIDEAITQAIKNGNDGLILQNANEVALDEKGLITAQKGTATSYAVFSPTQIKSATGNKGTFDLNKPSIIERRVNDSYNHLGRRISEGTLGRSPVEDTYHISVVTGYELLKTDPTVDKAMWSASMMKELGERARPHLDAVWDLVSSKAPTYYSPVENLIRTKVPNKASVEQIRGILKGVSEDEMKWSGLNNLLKEKKGTITKQELLDHLAVNNVKIETITSGVSVKPLEWKLMTPPESSEYHITSTDTVGYKYDIVFDEGSNQYLINWTSPEGEKSPTRKSSSVEAAHGLVESLRFDKKKPEEIVADEIELLKEAGYSIEELFIEAGGVQFLDSEGQAFDAEELPLELQQSARNVEEVYRNAAHSTGTRYSQYKLEGGQNYSEIKIQLPTNEKLPDKWRVYESENGAWVVEDSEGKPRGFGNTRDEAILATTHHGQFQPDNFFQSSHWDEPNILAHIRGDEREHTDGVEGFVIDETQSDWHTEGRKKGYVSGSQELPEGYDVVDLKDGRFAVEYTGGGFHDLIATDMSIEEVIRNALLNLRELKVPDAPFIKQWSLLTVRQSIRHAVERGLTRVSLMPARVHIDRWRTERAVWSQTYLAVDTKNNEVMNQDRKNDTEQKAKDWIEYRKRSGLNIDNYEVQKSFILQFEGQEGGVAGGILSKADSVIVRSKEELLAAINKNTYLANAEGIADKLWSKMQKEDEGISWPRAEGQLAHYGDTAEYIQQRFPGRPDLLKFAWDRPDGKQSEAFMPIAMRDVGKAWKSNVKISEVDTQPESDRDLGRSPVLYPVYSLDITPQMSNAVIRTGQPLYGTSADDPSYVLDAKMRMSPQGRKNIIDQGIVTGHQILSKENPRIQEAREMLDSGIIQGIKDSKIEKLQTSDIKEVIKVGAKAFPEHKNEFEQIVREGLDNDFGQSYVVTVKNKIVGGYLLGNHQLYDPRNPSTYDYEGKRGIEGVAIFVLPEYRGSGIGKALRNIPLTLDADYVWGMQFEDLNNLGNWVRFGRKHVMTEGGVHFTAQDLNELKTSNFKSWSNEMIRQLGESIRPHLDSIWSRLQQDTNLTELQSIRFNKPKATGESDPFYSALEEVIDEGMKGRMEAAQLKGYLRAQGITEDELRWTGFDDYLKERGMKEEKITKQEALDFLKNNRVELVETEFSEEKNKLRVERDKAANKLHDELLNDEYELSPSEVEEFVSFVQDAGVAGLPEIITRDLTQPQRTHLESLATTYFEAQNAFDANKDKQPKFGRADLVLPGGTNYKEMTLSLPTPSITESGWKEVNSGKHPLHPIFLRESLRDYTLIGQDKDADDQFAVLDEMGRSIGTGNSPESARATARANVEYYNSKNQFKTPQVHSYGIPEADINRLAHVRFDDRTDAEGKKVLFLNEIQSDWLQEGRKKGFKSENVAKAETEPDRYVVESYESSEGRTYYKYNDTQGTNGRAGYLTKEDAESAAEKANREWRETFKRKGVPDAPFSRTWPDLVLRRMIRYAAESGSRDWYEVTKPESSRKLIQDFFNGRELSGSSLDSMDASMIPMLQHDQIRRTVVENIPVDVVNMLSQNSFTPNQLISDPDMILQSLSIDDRASISRWISTSLMKVRANLRAALVPILMSRRDGELLPTLSASHLQPREVVALLSPVLITDTSSDIGIGRSALSTTEVSSESLPLGVRELSEEISPTRLADLLNSHDDIIHGYPQKSSKKYDAGYQRIAWTTGSQQAERYDLSKHAEAIRAKRHPDGEYMIDYKPKGGVAALNLVTSIPESKLADNVGKELAEKIAAQEGNDFVEYTELDLKVGGEGMKGFYDKILLSAANKIGKKWGAKVGQSNISNDFEIDVTYPDGSNDKLIYNTEAHMKGALRGLEKQAGTIINYSGQSRTETLVHSLNITPSMKDSVVREGQPLFGSEPPVLQKVRQLLLKEKKGVELESKKKDNKSRLELAREIQKLFQSVPKPEQKKYTNWSQVFKEEDALKALEAAEDVVGMELERKREGGKDKPDLSALFDELVPPSPEPPKQARKKRQYRAEDTYYEEEMSDVHEPTFKEVLGASNILTPWRAPVHAAKEAFNFLRSWVTGPDLSATGRQGGIAMAMMPAAGGKAFVKQVKAAVMSKQDFEKQMKELRAMSDFHLTEMMGVEYTNAASEREELFRSELADFVPWIRMSNQAMTSDLNWLRYYTAVAFAKELKDGVSWIPYVGQWISSGRIKGVDFKKDPGAYYSAGRFVNAITGRGDMSGIKESTNDLLNTVMFSARMQKARIDLLNPYVYAKMPRQAQLLTLRKMFEFTGLVMSVLTIAGALGAKVTLDPDDKDFGKLVIGDTHFDLTAGLSAYVRMFAVTARNLYRGQFKKTSEQWAHFWRGKLAPVPGSAVSLFYGTDFINKPTNFGRELIRNITPMLGDTMYEAYKDSGLGGMAMASPEFLGLSSSTYPPFTPPERTELEEKLLDRARKSFEDKPLTIEDKERIDVENKIVDLVKKDKIDDADKLFDKAIEDGNLAPEDEDRITKKAEMTYLQYRVSGMPFEEALDIFLDPDATKQEREDLSLIIEQKYESWAKQRDDEEKSGKVTISRKVYERVQSKLEKALAAGLEELTDRAAEKKAKAATVK